VDPPLRRSQRVSKPVDRPTYSWSTEITSDIPGEIMYLTAMYPMEDLNTDPLMALAASTDTDTMYYNQSMEQPDRLKFIEAMIDEVMGQMANQNFATVKRSNLPEGACILPSVWQMKRKRIIATGEVYKWKARCNIDGSKQIQDVDYDQTHSPVAGWASIRMIPIKAIIAKYYSCQINYVLAYTQAEIE
jgi:Reverse transcriptase (RNA-dependent DNA polymerase)